MAKHEDWLTIKEAADRYFHGKVMRLYRRIWAGEIVASNIAITGTVRPKLRVSDSAMQAYFSGHQMVAPSRTAGAR